MTSELCHKSATKDGSLSGVGARSKASRSNVPAGLLAAQQILGNRAVSMFLQSNALRAGRAVIGPSADVSVMPGGKATSPSELSAQLGPGAPLPADVRGYFEPRFGADFSNVRIFEGDPAATAAQAVNADAFTIGQNIAFNSGRFAPSTAGGRRLLGHELAHVVQQSRGGAPPALTESSLEASAERAATAAVHGGAVQVTGASGIGLARQLSDESTGLVGESWDEPQLWFTESKALRFPVKSTKGGAGFTDKHYEHAEDLADLWGAPDDYHLGHEQETPLWSQPAGTVSDVGIQSAEANLRQSAIERRDSQAAKARGEFGRVERKTDITAPNSRPGRWQPKLPERGGISPKPLTVDGKVAPKIEPSSAAQEAWKIEQAAKPPAAAPSTGPLPEQLDLPGVSATATKDAAGAADVGKDATAVAEATTDATVISQSTQLAQDAKAVSTIATTASPVAKTLVPATKEAGALSKAVSGTIKIAKPAVKVLAPVAKVVGEVAKPLGVIAAANDLATAHNNTDRLVAAGDLAAGVAAYGGPVGDAFSVGYTVGGLADKGIEKASKAAFGVDLSPSNGVSHALDAPDKLVSAVIPDDPNKPAYKNKNKLAWFLIDKLGL